MSPNYVFPSHPTPHTSHLTPHTPHPTPHTSHLTPHTSHPTPHTYTSLTHDSGHIFLCLLRSSGVEDRGHIENVVPCIAGATAIDDQVTLKTVEMNGPAAWQNDLTQQVVHSHTLFAQSGCFGMMVNLAFL